MTQAAVDEGPEPCSVEDAIAALVAAAFKVGGTCGECGQPNGTPEREIVHCVFGGIGCDWDLEDAVALVETEGAECWWGVSLLRGHGLAVALPDDRSTRFFDGVKPVAPAPDEA